MADEIIQSEGSAIGAEGIQAPAPEYVSKADFQAFQQNFERTISGLTPREAAADRKETGPKEPDPRNYDFTKPGEYARHTRDVHKWNSHLDAQENKPAEEKRQAEQSVRESARNHAQRMADYREKNPGFDADLKAAAGKLNVLDDVKNAVYASKNSALALHYMAKNPDAAQELNFIYESDGIQAVRERVGEMAAEMRGQAKLAESQTEAAGQRPPRMNLRGGVANKPAGTKDYGSVFKSFRT